MTKPIPTNRSATVHCLCRTVNFCLGGNLAMKKFFFAILLSLSFTPAVARDGWSIDFYAGILSFEKTGEVYNNADYVLPPDVSANAYYDDLEEGQSNACQDLTSFYVVLMFGAGIYKYREDGWFSDISFYLDKSPEGKWVIDNPSISISTTRRDQESVFSDRINAIGTHRVESHEDRRVDIVLNDMRCVDRQHIHFDFDIQGELFSREAIINENGGLVYISRGPTHSEAAIKADFFITKYIDYD